MSLLWADIQKAIQDWAEQGTALPDGRVIWAMQAGATPVRPYVALRVMDVERIGMDWVDVEDAPDPAPGAEIDTIARGVRQGTLRVQCFGGPPIGADSAIGRLERMVAAAALPDIAAALNAAGVGILDIGPVQSIDGMDGSLFEPRAVVDVTLSLASEIILTSTYISAVKAQRVDEHGDGAAPEFTIGTPASP